MTQSQVTKGLKPKHVLIPLVVIVVLLLVYLWTRRKQVATASPLPKGATNNLVTFDPLHPNSLPDVSWGNQLNVQNNGGSVSTGGSPINTVANIETAAPGALDLSSIDYNMRPQQNIQVIDAPSLSVGAGACCDECSASGGCRTTCRNGCGTVGGRDIYNQNCHTTEYEMVRSQPRGYWQDYTANVLSGLNTRRTFRNPSLDANGMPVAFSRPDNAAETAFSFPDESGIPFGRPINMIDII